MNLLRSFTILLLFCLYSIAVANENESKTQTDDATIASVDTGKMIDKTLEKWDRSNTPGVAVAVMEKGELVFEKGYGIANLEYDIPVVPETVFHVASVSKQFTAMALVLLEQDGKLSLEDDIHRYLPELPDYGYKITIRNLLQHTSGIRDQWQTLAVAGWSLQDVITQDQILRMLFRQKELNFAPEYRQLYSNGGYTLAAEIVHRISEQEFPDFCQDKIFEPLGMTRTHFHQDLTQLVPGRAYSYRKKEGGYVASPLNYANVGATSLFTTAGDLVKWLDNFRNPIVGKAAGIESMQSVCTLSNGSDRPYGLGVSLRKHRGLQCISHGGGDAGYRSYVSYYPKHELAIAVAGNGASFNSTRAAREIAEIFLGEHMNPIAPEFETQERAFVSVDSVTLKKYVGTYPLPQIGQTIVVEFKDGKLWAAGQIQPPSELKPTGPSSFYLGRLRADIDFLPKDNEGMLVTITQPGYVNEGTRIVANPIDKEPVAVQDYAGAYWSEELETQYSIIVKDDKLFAMHSHHGEIALMPAIKDQFRTNQFFMREVKFIRDESGITGLTLGGGRVTAIRFDRR